MAVIENQEYRCNCGKLLFKSPEFSGVVEVKCRRCGKVKSFQREIKKPVLGV